MKTFLRLPPNPVPLKFGCTGALFASRMIKVESFLEELESVSRSRDVRGVVGRETAPSEPPLLNKIESDIFRLELTLTVSFFTDCFGLRCVELNDESFYGFFRRGKTGTHEPLGPSTWSVRTKLLQTENFVLVHPAQSHEK